MIVHVDDALHHRFLAACELTPMLGAQICTEYLSLGNASSQAGFWLMRSSLGEDTAALGLVHGRMTISAADEADTAELTAFVRAMGWGVTDGVLQLTAPVPLCKRIGLSGQRCMGPCMTHAGPPPTVYPHLEVTEQPPLEQVYHALKTGFSGYSEPWERWYVQTSYLIRHELGFVLGLPAEDNMLASTAGVYAMGKRLGVIGCVTTLPAYRGRGYARQLVEALCTRLFLLGKTPALLCAEESLAAYYGRMGFRSAGRWGRVYAGDPRTPLLATKRRIL